MNYTYRDLLEALQEMTSDELDLHVTIYDRTNDIYHPLNYTGKTEDDDVLDADHPILIINDPEETVSEPHQEVIHTFPDVRSCEIWVEFEDGSTMTVSDFLDMDDCIETQIRDTFENHIAIDDDKPNKIVNFKWKELGI